MLSKEQAADVRNQIADLKEEEAELEKILSNEYSDKACEGDTTMQHNQRRIKEKLEIRQDKRVKLEYELRHLSDDEEGSTAG